MEKHLLFLAACTLAVATGNAATFKDGVFSFTTTSETTVELTKADSKDADGKKIDAYVVPQTVSDGSATYTVTAIGEEAFKWNYATSISLPETIEVFSTSAFNGCSELSEINIPAALEIIGDYAFSGCKSIKSIDIPASVKSIGNSAFFTATGLTSITFHEGLESIGNSAFYKAGITTAVLPESVTELGPKAFYYSKIESVKLPSQITKLETGLFRDCVNLTSIDIPESVTEIGDECFLGCTSLTKLDIPAAVTKIGTSLISKTAVPEIGLAAGNRDFVLIDGVLYGADKRLLYAVPMTGKSEVNVEAGCVGSNGGACWGCQVTKVTLPEGMLAIDDYAFCQSELAEINFPATMTYIGEQGFAATKLTEVELPANMPYILDGAFAGCENLVSVTIPSGVKLIYNHAFHNDTKLASVTCLGATAPEIDDVYETYDSPFYGVPETTPLYVPKGSVASYQEAGWGTYFKITESDQSTFAYTSITPADGTVLGAWADMVVNIEFDSDITIVTQNPEVFLRKGSELSGAVIEPDLGWNAVKGDNNRTLRVWGADYDYYPMTFKAEEGAEYYLVIPAGIVKNAAGDLNERIVINWHGPAAHKELAVESTTPANGAEIAAGDVEMSFIVTFADDISVVDFGPDATLRKDDATTGTKIEPDLYWKATKENDKAVKVFGMDYDSFIQLFKVEDGVTYYMTIPAGIVQNAAGDKNGEIVISFTGNSSLGIGSIGTDGVFETERFDINGRKVGPGYKGVTIIRMTDGSVRKAMQK